MKLDRAEALIAEVFSVARTARARPLAAVVVDEGGHIVASARQDGASIARHEFARAKSWSAIALGLDTRDLATRAKAHPEFFGAAANLFAGRLLPAAGGILLRDGDGSVIGGLGVSGDTAETDDLCAVTAAKATGLMLEG